MFVGRHSFDVDDDCAEFFLPIEMPCIRFYFTRIRYFTIYIPASCISQSRLYFWNKREEIWKKTCFCFIEDTRRPYTIFSSDFDYEIKDFPYVSHSISSLFSSIFSPFSFFHIFFFLLCSNSSVDNLLKTAQKRMRTKSEETTRFVIIGQKSSKFLQSSNKKELDSFFYLQENVVFHSPLFFKFDLMKSRTSLTSKEFRL